MGTAAAAARGFSLKHLARNGHQLLVESGCRDFSFGVGQILSLDCGLSVGTWGIVGLSAQWYRGKI